MDTGLMGYCLNSLKAMHKTYIMHNMYKVYNRYKLHKLLFTV